jgi:homogentisate 1,2-dioxygenase
MTKKASGTQLIGDVQTWRTTILLQTRSLAVRCRRLARNVRGSNFPFLPAYLKHPSYVPYKYALEKFVNVGSISKDHIDPSIFCVLTAKSKISHHPLVDFLIFSPRWDVANHTFRPPYYHRNSSTEFMGLLYGNYGGRSDGFQPGGASYETGFCPHGGGHPFFLFGK